MKTKEMTLTAIMVTILIICSQLSIPIGPIPITLQSLSVLMIGYLLKPKTALLTTSLYLFMGLIGFPIFSSFSGGIQAMLIPSFGFILGFIPASYVQAKYLEKYSNPEVKHLIIAGVLNLLITYLIGLTYMAGILNLYLGQHLTLGGILMTGFIPFIPGDILKLSIGVLLARRLLPVIHQRFSMTS